MSDKRYKTPRPVRARMGRGGGGACGIVVRAALFICPALLIAFGSCAFAERDVGYIIELRRQGYFELAEKEANRLLARDNLDEETRAALTLEKARIAEDHALATHRDDADQIELIIKARNAFRTFIRQYPSSPQKVDADFELQYLNRVLGQLRARQARFEAGRRRAEFAKMARLALNEAADGYERLRRDFTARRDALKANARKLRDRREDEKAKPRPDRTVLRDIESRLEKLDEDINASEYSIIQCRCLAADSNVRLGEALKNIKGCERESAGLLREALDGYDKLFNDYRNTPYIESAYTSLCESVRVICLMGEPRRAYRRILTEKVYFLITYRERIGKEDLFKKILAQMRWVTAEALNGLGRYEGARKQARLVIRSSAGGAFADGAGLEMAKSYKGEGDIGAAVRMLGRVALKAGPFQEKAIDLLAGWMEEDIEITAKYPAEILFNLAMHFFRERRYKETIQILDSLIEKTGKDDKWGPKSLLYLAEVHCRLALADKSKLEGAGRISEGEAAYFRGLKESVGIIMNRLVAQYGGSKAPDVLEIVRGSLYRALDWQNQILRNEPGKDQEVRLENILATFNDLFPGAPSIPDANYLRGARLEMAGKYAEAIEKYKAVSPERNQSITAGLRAVLCRCRLYQARQSPNADMFGALWKELNEGIENVEGALKADSSKLEEYERAQFSAVLLEGEYVRALMLFSAGEKEARAALGGNADKYEKAKNLLDDFSRRHPSSAYAGRVTFMLVQSKIALGETAAAEADVERLKENPELYKNSLAALRDSYYNLYVQAEETGDGESARKFSEKYITLAVLYEKNFREEMTPGDLMRMGGCLYRSGRYGQAEGVLSRAWRSFDEVLRTGAYSTPGAAAGARDALRSIGEKLGEILIVGGDSEKADKALEIYDRLLDLRLKVLEEKYADKEELKDALEKDPLTVYYRTRRAVAVIALQDDAGEDIPDFDSLIAAVDTLARTAGMRRQFTSEWWFIEYWLAYGLFLQRDFHSASRVIGNLAAVSGNFSDKSGAGSVAMHGKSFRVLFEELGRKIAFEQR